MKFIKFYGLLVLSSLIVLLPASAYAHPVIGRGAGFLNGFVHPLGGLEHVLVMFAVGLWAYQIGGKALWAVPAAFVTVMLLGCFLGIMGLYIPFVEGGIITSLLVLGLLIAAAARLPLAAGMAIVAVFALFHGHAHGTEMPFSVSGLSYGAGFAVATALLHTSGIVSGAFFNKRLGALLIRYSGAAIAAAGVYLVFA